MLQRSRGLKDADSPKHLASLVMRTPPVRVIHPGHDHVRALVAQLQETRLRNPDAAFQAYGQAIRDALAEPQLSSLLDAYERLAGEEKTADVIALFREIAPDVLDENVKTRLDRVIAQGALRLGNAELAAECMGVSAADD